MILTPSPSEPFDNSDVGTDSNLWPATDRPRHDECDFWAGAEHPSPKRPARALEHTQGGPHLARERDLVALLHAMDDCTDSVIPGTTPIVEATEDGSALEFLYGKTLYIPRGLRRRHLLVVGCTGCGKTTRVNLPLIRSDIANPKLTVVIIDTSGELERAARSFTKLYRPGKQVKVIDLLDATRSLGWNPMAAIESSADALELAHAIAFSVPGARQSADSQFFTYTAIDLTAAIMLTERREHGDKASLASVLRVMDLPVAELGKYAAKHSDITSLERFADYVATSSHNAETVLAVARSVMLLLWRNEEVAKVTATHQFDFSELFVEPSVLVVQVPEEKVDELKPVTNTWTNQLFAAALKAARSLPRGELPVLLALHIEEFASAVGRIPNIENRLNTVRKAGLFVTASVQSTRQVANVYGTAFDAVMTGFSSSVVFGGCSTEDARYYSQESGDTTVFESIVAVQEPPPGDYVESSRRTITERAVVRPLLTPSDIQHPPKNEMCGSAVTCFFADMPPFQVFLTPLFELLGGARLLESAEVLGLSGQPEVPLPTPYGAPPTRSIPSTLASANITDTGDWDEGRLRKHLIAVLECLDLGGASARAWWRDFQSKSQARDKLALLVRVAEEIRSQGETVQGFFLAYVHSNTDNIQACLHFMAYARLDPFEVPPGACFEPSSGATSSPALMGEVA